MTVTGSNSTLEYLARPSASLPVYKIEGHGLAPQRLAAVVVGQVPEGLPHLVRIAVRGPERAAAPVVPLGGQLALGAAEAPLLPEL